MKKIKIWTTNYFDALFPDEGALSGDLAIMAGADDWVSAFIEIGAVEGLFIKVDWSIRTIMLAAWSGESVGILLDMTGNDAGRFSAEASSTKFVLVLSPSLSICK